MNNETLTTWTTLVFKLIKEFDQTKNCRQYTIENDHTSFLVNAVDPEKFLSLLEKYASRAAEDMSNKNVWIDGKAPEQSFFTFDKLLQTIDVDITSYEAEQKSEEWESEHLFVQKAILPEGSEIAFFGDYHGSIHSCLRNLWRLVASGHLDTSFQIIKDNFYIVALGDYLDRGHFGLEVIYTLLLLKLAPGNWDKVFLLKGNHETINQSTWETSSTGVTFFAELALKFGTTQGEKWNTNKESCKTISIHGQKKELSSVILLTTIQWYTYLPLALFVGNGNGEYIQCSHGGIEQGYDYALIKQDGTEVFQKLDGLYIADPENEHSIRFAHPWRVHTGLNWSDFAQKSQYEDTGSKEYIESNRGCGVNPGTKWTEKYLIKHPFLKGFFRGHQDLFFGFKMLFKSDQLPTEQNFIERVKSVEKKEKLNDALISIWRTYAQDEQDKVARQCAYEETEYECNDTIHHQNQEKIKKAYSDEYKKTQERFQSFYALSEKIGEYTYNKGPFFWKVVVKDQDQSDPRGFLINNYFPVFTFTSAPFGRGLNGNCFPFDCYGILQLSGDYAHWRLRVYEYMLAYDRNNKYVSISFAKNLGMNTDALEIQWSENPKQKCCPQ